MNYRTEYHEVDAIIIKDGKTLKVVESGTCEGCFFHGYYSDCDDLSLICLASLRPDKKSVIFVEVMR